MVTLASDTGGGTDFTPVPAGTHFAVCDQFVDLGKQRIVSQMFGESIKNQVYIRWQIPSERVEWEVDGIKHEGPAVIGKTYTLSLSDKANLRKDLQAWRGKPFTPDELRGFDVAAVVGVPCTLTVTHTEKDGRTYANVASLGGVPKGMTPPKLEGDPLIYDKDNLGSFERLSKRMQERVKAQIIDDAKGNGGWVGQTPDHGGFADELDDDIPF